MVIIQQTYKLTYNIWQLLNKVNFMFFEKLGLMLKFFFKKLKLALARVLPAHGRGHGTRPLLTEWNDIPVTFSDILNPRSHLTFRIYARSSPRVAGKDLEAPQF